MCPIRAPLVVLAAAVLGGGCQYDRLDPGARRTTRTEVRELTPAAGEIAMPLHEGSVRFAVIGDSDAETTRSARLRSR